MLRWQDLRGLRNEDRVVDFSFAGYQQSCRPLPPHTALRPSQVLQSTQDGRDRAKDIQMAIDEIASQGGGVLQLGPGPFVLETDALQLPSGLILQGHADGPEPTVFVIQGRNRAAVMIGPKEPQRPEFKHKTQIRDQYIGAGAHCITVEKPEVFKPGMLVALERQVSNEWLHALQMDKLVRNGKPQTWMKSGSRQHDIRRVMAIEGNAVRLEAPLTDSLDKELTPSATLCCYTPPSDACEEIGISSINFQLQPSQCSSVVHAKEGIMQGIVVNPHSSNCWIRQCHFRGFASSVNVMKQTRQITVQDCTATRDAPTDKSSGYAADFAVGGDMILILRCATIGDKGTDSISPAIQARANLVAIVGHKSTHSYIQTHQRWATGILIDGCNSKDIELVNRGNMGTGQGLSASNSVVWNSRGWRRVNVDSTPLSHNFAVGCESNTKDITASGQYISPGQHVQPFGLFAQQLVDRLGRDMAQQVLNMVI